MEATGTSEYKKRRVVFKIEQTWKNSDVKDRKLYLFDTADEEIQKSILEKISLESDDLPILVSFTDTHDWCFLSTYSIIFPNADNIIKVPLSQIAKSGSCWGKLSEEDKIEKCGGKLKISPCCL